MPGADGHEFELKNPAQNFLFKTLVSLSRSRDVESQDRQTRQETEREREGKREKESNRKWRPTSG